MKALLFGLCLALVAAPALAKGGGSAAGAAAVAAVATMAGKTAKAAVPAAQQIIRAATYTDEPQPPGPALNAESTYAAPVVCSDWIAFTCGK